MQDFSAKNARRRNRNKVRHEIATQRQRGGITWEQQQNAAAAMRKIHNAGL